MIGWAQVMGGARRSRTLLLLAGLLLLAACSSADDGAGIDAGGTPDTVLPDGGTPDTEGDIATADIAPTDSIQDTTPDIGDTHAPPDTATERDATGDTLPGDTSAADGEETAAPDTSPDGDDVPDPPAECERAQDCLASLPPNDPCAIVVCDDGRCRPMRRPGCCVTDLECFDWDPCTAALCVDASCVYVPQGDDCCAGEWLLQERFATAAPAGWTFDEAAPGRAHWHVSDRRVASGMYSLAFHNPETGAYASDYRERGAAFGPWTAIPDDAEQPLFRFDLYLDTEWRNFEHAQWVDPWPLLYDRLLVEIDDGSRIVEVWSSYSVDVRGTTCERWPLPGRPACTFKTFVFDLSPFRGRTVRPIFRFDTGDHVDNDYEGPFIDNVGVLLDCGPPPECLVSADCDGDPCYDGFCRNNRCDYVPNYRPGCCYDFEHANWQFDPLSLSGFTPSPADAMVRWHPSDRRFVTAPSSLRFGHVLDATYDLPGQAVAGIATSTAVALANWLPMMFYASVYIDLEPFDPALPERDLFRILLYDVTGAPFDLENATVTVLWDRADLSPEDYGVWVPLEISLDAFVGRVIRIRFQVSSGDAENNTSEGVYIDDVRIVRHCP